MVLEFYDEGTVPGLMYLVHMLKDFGYLCYDTQSLSGSKQFLCNCLNFIHLNYLWETDDHYCCVHTFSLPVTAKVSKC